MLNRSGWDHPGPGRPRKEFVQQVVQHYDELYELSSPEERAKIHAVLVSECMKGNIRAIQEYNNRIYPTPPMPKEVRHTADQPLFSPASFATPIPNTVIEHEEEPEPNTDG